MSRKQLAPLPARPFGLLLVEGGDERGACMHVAGPAWSGLHCWYGDGQSDIPRLAEVAKRDPNFSFARSVGIVLDAEDDPTEAARLAGQALAVFGFTSVPTHGQLSTGRPQLGAFISPDGSRPGAIETLCRQAVRSPTAAGCVDALITCVGTPHARRALADKGWLKAYLGMTADPTLRFHHAFETPDGIDPSHRAFDALRGFLQRL